MNDDNEGEFCATVAGQMIVLCALALLMLGALIGALIGAQL